MTRGIGTEYVKTIDHVTRIGLSGLGNPRFRLHFTDGTTATTKPNTSIAYGLPNSLWEGVPVRITANGRGEVFDIVPETEGDAR